MDGDELEGCFVWDGEGEADMPYAVVVDGRRLTWEEFGRTLEAYQGWRFRLQILDMDTVDGPPSEAPWWQVSWTAEDT